MYGVPPLTSYVTGWFGSAEQNAAAATQALTAASLVAKNENADVASATAVVTSLEDAVHNAANNSPEAVKAAAELTTAKLHLQTEQQQAEAATNLETAAKAAAAAATEKVAEEKLAAAQTAAEQAAAEQAVATTKAAAAEEAVKNPSWAASAKNLYYNPSESVTNMWNDPSSLLHTVKQQVIGRVATSALMGVMGATALAARGVEASIQPSAPTDTSRHRPTSSSRHASRSASQAPSTTDARRTDARRTGASNSSRSHHSDKPHQSSSTLQQMAAYIVEHSESGLEGAASAVNELADALDKEYALSNDERRSLHGLVMDAYKRADPDAYKDFVQSARELRAGHPGAPGAPSEPSALFDTSPVRRALLYDIAVHIARSTIGGTPEDATDLYVSAVRAFNLSWPEQVQLLEHHQRIAPVVSAQARRANEQQAYEQRAYDQRAYEQRKQQQHHLPHRQVHRQVQPDPPSHSRNRHRQRKGFRARLPLSLRASPRVVRHRQMLESPRRFFRHMHQPRFHGLQNV